MVYPVDGMACKEARAAKRRIAALLAAKWDRQYIELAAFVWTRTSSLAIVRSNTLLLWGDRLTSWHRKAPETSPAASAARNSNL